MLDDLDDHHNLIVRDVNPATADLRLGVRLREFGLRQLIDIVVVGMYGTSLYVHLYETSVRHRKLYRAPFEIRFTSLLHCTRKCVS